MWRQSTLLISLFLEIFSVNCLPSPCSFICLNQTSTQAKPPPIYLNDSTTNALVFFTINCVSNESLAYANLSLSIDNPHSIEIRNSLPFYVLPFGNQSQNLTFNLTIHGKLLGYSRLSLHTDYFNTEKLPLNFTDDLHVDFAVKKKSTILDIIFTVVVVLLVCIGTFLIGCRLMTQNLYANIRRPVPILIGLFSQFLCLPLVR